MQSVCLFSTADSPWIILPLTSCTAEYVKKKKIIKKKEVALGVSKLWWSWWIHLLLSHHWTLVLIMMLANDTTHKWIFQKMQLLSKKGNRKVREKNGHLENVAPPQSFFKKKKLPWEEEGRASLEFWLLIRMQNFCRSEVTDTKHRPHYLPRTTRCSRQ